MQDIENSQKVRRLVVVWALALSGCMPWVGINQFAGGSIGTTSSGLLVAGEHLPARGDHFRFYHRGDRRYGVPALTGMIERAAARIAKEHTGSVLWVGDMSARTGGFIGGHRSHRSGRDVDLAFYVTSSRRRTARGVPLIRFDRFGVGVRDKRAYFYDTERNWLLVEAMLTDPEAEVQWIFASDGIKALLLEWALDHGRDIALIEKAATILHQPGDSSPHDDHFHVRIYCPKGPGSPYCVDTGPIRPWIKRDDHPQSGFTRDELIRLALES
ncbi:MAG: hypothetical protein GY854_23355 [Deltaproteobacteria bacterium]|nr:hypothetical protein [Deltaproteobacteria bacterium]